MKNCSPKAKRTAGTRFCLTLSALAALGVFAGLAAPSAQAAPRPALVWRGDVDDTTVIYFHGADVRTRDVAGKGSAQTSAQVFDRLPRGPVQVFLTRRDGRGEIRVIQQPSPDNGFTAAVRVRDSQAGRGHYEFALDWADRGGPRGGRVFRGGDGFGGEGLGNGRRVFRGGLDNGR